MTTLERILRSLHRQIQLIATRALVSLVDDERAMQTIQARLLRREVRDDVEHFQSYGFASKTKPPTGELGAEAIVLFLGGSRDHGVAIAVGDRRFRLKGLADGESALYDDLGHKVHLTRAGIVIDGAGQQVRITNTPKLRVEAALEVTGNADVGGNLVAVGDVSDQSGTAQTMAAMRATFNVHTHDIHAVASGGQTRTSDPPPLPM